MTRASAFVRACHPEPTVAVTALVTALAVSAGQGGRAAITGLALLTGQLSIGWSNDWIDAGRDRRTGRADKPAARDDISPAALRVAALLAAAVCVPVSLAMGLAAGALHLAAVASGWAYNARLKATALSWLPYALSFGALPSVVTLGLPGHPFAPLWATAAGALLGVGAHLANALPDLEDDLATGVRGLPHRLGRAASAGLSAVLLLATTAALVFGPGRPGPIRLAALGLALVITAAALTRAAHPGSRAAFRGVLAVAAVDIALLVASGSSLVAS